MRIERDLSMFQVSTVSIFFRASDRDDVSRLLQLFVALHQQGWNSRFQATRADDEARIRRIGERLDAMGGSAAEQR